LKKPESYGNLQNVQIIKAMKEDIISIFWGKKVYAKTKKKIIQSNCERLYKDRIKKSGKNWKRKANRKTESDCERLYKDRIKSLAKTEKESK
jgi:hypothetical protein